MVEAARPRAEKSGLVRYSASALNVPIPRCRRIAIARPISIQETAPIDLRGEYPHHEMEIMIEPHSLHPDFWIS
jgi:hypothetical protein